MTKAELMTESERFKEALKEIYSCASLEPFEESEEEKKYYDNGDHAVVYARHLGIIQANVRFALDPEWMYRNLTDEEEAEFIASL